MKRKAETTTNRTDIAPIPLLESVGLGGCDDCAEEVVGLFDVSLDDCCDDCCEDGCEDCCEECWDDCEGCWDDCEGCWEEVDGGGVLDELSDEYDGSSPATLHSFPG